MSFKEKVKSGFLRFGQGVQKTVQRIDQYQKDQVAKQMKNQELQMEKLRTEAARYKLMEKQFDERTKLQNRINRAKKKIQPQHQEQRFSPWGRY